MPYCHLPNAPFRLRNRWGFRPRRGDLPNVSDLVAGYQLAFRSSYHQIETGELMRRHVLASVPVGEAAASVGMGLAVGGRNEAGER
jgi:hypothetical protein